MSLTDYAQGVNILDTEQINNVAKNINEYNIDRDNNKKMGFYYRTISNIDGERTIIDQSVYFEEKNDKIFFSGEEFLDYSKQYLEYVKNNVEFKKYSNLEVQVVLYLSYEINNVDNNNSDFSKVKNVINKIRYFSEDLNNNKNKKTI